MKRTTIIFSLFILMGCGVPYPGLRTILPNKNIKVVDESNTPLTSYDLFVYRCTDPGSQLDRHFSYPTQISSNFTLEERTEFTWKRAGWQKITPDFYVAYEPEPYWVVCVRKPGFASRRWNVSGKGDAPVSIALTKSESEGPDICTVENNKCTPCKSYEYFFYENMRYKHKDCD